MLRFSMRHSLSSPIYIMRQLFFLVQLLCCSFVFACTSAKSETKPMEIPPLESGEVERVYGLYEKGQYAQYVAEMASCDKAPESYRKQMADLHKQHAVLQKEKMGGVISTKVIKLEPSSTGRQTNVTLRVNYGNQTHEEVLLSFVWVNHRWRLR